MDDYKSLKTTLEGNEYAQTIRLVYRGGTLIDQDMSQKLFEKIQLDKQESSLPNTTRGSSFS